MKSHEVSTELQDFIEDLEVWAKNWIDEVNDVVVQHIDELFKDEAIRYLVKKYKEAKTTDEKLNKGYLLGAYMYEDKVMRNKHYNLDTYSQALYELCYKRYVKEK